MGSLEKRLLDKSMQISSVGPSSLALRVIMPRGSSLAALARALHAVHLRNCNVSRSSTCRNGRAYTELSPPNNRNRRSLRKHDPAVPNPRRCYRLSQL